MKTFFNLVLVAIGGILGNLISAMIQQDAWGNVFTPTRVLTTIVGLALVLLILTLLDIQGQKAVPPEQGIVRNIQIGPALIRVLRGTNVYGNIQIGGGTIEVVDSNPSRKSSNTQPRP